MAWATKDDFREPIYRSFTRKPDTAAMRATFRQFLTDESGATAIEYGLIAAGISVAIIAVVNDLGTKLHTTFSSISTQLK
jgi:pilus assembly protein Flp/PilA